jgi:hypothetical protein
MPSIILEDFSNPSTLYFPEIASILLLVTNGNVMYSLWGACLSSGIVWNTGNISTVASSVLATVSPAITRDESGLIVVEYTDTNNNMCQVTSTDLGLSWN